MANYFQIFLSLVFSYRLSFFTNRENFQVRTWVWRKFAVENRENFQRGDWTGVKWRSQSRKTNFLTFPPSASSTRDQGTRVAVFLFFSSRCFLIIKGIENMFSVFLSSYRNARESSGKLEKAVETLACGMCSHSISRSHKPPLVLL